MFVSIIFVSCIPEPIDNYKGSIVCEKYNTDKITIKRLDKDSNYYFSTIYVLKIDFDRYNLGDTIK